MTDKPLAGKIALVAGATRGAGRGIAHMLGEAGATVYCSGRSTRTQRSSIGRPESIDHTADLVTAAGGTGIAVQTDHGDSAAVADLMSRIQTDAGHLDVLVNDIGGESLAEWKPLADANLERGFEFIHTAVHTHIITAHHAVPLLQVRGGLIVEITDGDHAGYRGALFYDLVKNQVIRLAFALNAELSRQGITALALTPGFLRSEAMLDNFGVSEANWRDAIDKVQGFEESETPCFVGRAVAALAADPQVGRRGGQVLASWNLAREYGFADIDGRRPDWIRHVERSIDAIIDAGGPANPDQRYWLRAWHDTLGSDPRFALLRDRTAPWLDHEPPTGEQAESNTS